MKILYVANVDWFFISHRLPLAQEAVRRGWEVYLIAGDTGKGQFVEQFGVKYIPWSLSRSGLNPFHELKSFIFLYEKYKEIKPDILHHIALKPVVYGTIISNLLKVDKVFNALSGLGYSFTNERIIGKIIVLFLKIILRNGNNKLILQNKDDVLLFIKKKIVKKEKIILIKGSGVDTDIFHWVDEPKYKPLLVLLPSRMLADKGVREFMQVAEKLKCRDGIKFVLVGGIDKENPAWISEEEILQWVKSNILEWWGHQVDMKEVISKSNIIVLPSYREGLPKVLIEASALGRAIVTTNVPGCREIIVHGKNGLLVNSRDVDDLEKAILLLIEDEGLRLKLALEARKIAENDYSIKTVIAQTFTLYGYP